MAMCGGGAPRFEEAPVLTREGSGASAKRRAPRPRIHTDFTRNHADYIGLRPAVFVWMDVAWDKADAKFPWTIPADRPRRSFVRRSLGA